MTDVLRKELALQGGKTIKCIKAGGAYFYKDVCIKRFGKGYIVVGTAKGEYLIPLRKLDYVQFENEKKTE